MTHLGSGWEQLAEVLNTHPRIQVYTTGNSYSHPDDVIKLRSQPHKRGGAASVWVDVIFHNKDFAMRRLAQHYKMVFWSRRFEDCAESLIYQHGYGSEQAESYHGFRLEGMRQYWERKKGSLWNPELKLDSLLGAVL